MCSFPNFEPVSCSMSSSYCCFLNCIQVFQEIGKEIFYSHLFKNFPVCCDSHSQSLKWSMKQKLMFFLEFACFFDDPMDVGNLTSGSSTFSKSNLNICSWFSYCWDIAWRILIVTLLDVKYGQLCNSLNILWRCPFLGLGWKLTISSPAANAEFSKFAGIWVQHFNSIIF